MCKQTLPGSQRYPTLELQPNSSSVHAPGGSAMPLLSPLGHEEEGACSALPRAWPCPPPPPHSCPSSRAQSSLFLVADDRVFAGCFLLSPSFLFVSGVASCEILYGKTGQPRKELMGQQFFSGAVFSTDIPR